MTFVNVCEAFSAYEKKCGSSCEQILTKRRRKTNKCLTAGVRLEFGCRPPRVIPVCRSFPRKDDRQREKDEQGPL